MESKRQYGKCRCCLIKGNHRSLFEEYHKAGKPINYNDYFLECFNVYLSTSSKLTELICSSCIRQLLEARRFRTRVIRNEKRLLKAGRHAVQTEFVNVVLQHPSTEDEQVTVKQEPEADSCDCPANPAEDLETPDLKYDDSGSDSELVPGERELLARFPCRPPPLPTRDSLFTLCPVYYGRLELLRDKVISANSIDLTTPARKEKILVSTNKKQAHVLNATVLLECSNATAFKTKMRSGFPCFYCRSIFSNPKVLREHQTKHKKSQLFKLLSQYSADALVVYADVTNLRCTICENSLATLDELKVHLVELHGKKIYSDVEERVIPFKLEDRESDYECQVCGKRFETFGATERHMNVHYSNFVCEACGAGFVTRRRLKVHTYIVHSKNKNLIKCDPCKKTFETKLKYKIHSENVHKKLKKMRCSQCSETFIDFFTRQRHLENTHGADLLTYKCEECARTFNRKYSLTCHYKRIHLATKDVQCDLCPFMCYNKSELREHMYKHGGKVFECVLCQKTFARKRTLTVHMKVHSEERRFSCHVCGEGFVQSCSLKAHLKSHNVEFKDL